MDTIGSVKQSLMCQLLSVPMLRRNTYLLYSLWSVVLILSYYEFGFKVIYISSDHVFNFFITSIINVIAYLFVDKMHSRFGEKRLIIICFSLYAIAHELESYLGRPKNEQMSYGTGLDIAEQFGVTGIYGFIFTSSTEMYNEVIRETTKEEVKTKKKIPVHIRDITLANSVYPRISKVLSWLEKRYSSILDKQYLEEIKRKADVHVLILQTESPSDNFKICYSKRDIKDEDCKHFEDVYSAQQELEKCVDKYTSVPFSILCVLKIDENGCIVKQDKKLISRIQKKILPKLADRDVEVIYVITAGTNCDLKTISCTIQYKLAKKGRNNGIYCRTFDAGDFENIRKRIGLHLEKMFETKVVQSLKAQDQSSNETALPQSSNQDQTTSKAISQKWAEIISYFKHPRPDNCEMHDLKVLLERSVDVKGYGFEDNKIMVFVMDHEKKTVVKSYLKKYFPEFEDQIIYKIWEHDSEISKCVLTQGSKIVQQDSPRFGTLGMFLKDKKENIYFTTCSHVTEKGEIAKDEDGTVLGKSVFSIDTGTDTNYSELIDLSIIKVDDLMTTRCQFGLRNLDNYHEIGEIVDEESIDPELKVYKWGAASSLTRGTYKGWIASKDNQNRFDQNLHRIASDSKNMFEKGDSGSLICIEATESPHLDSNSAAFIFVGKLVSKNECMSSTSGSDQWYYCYHVSKIFQHHVDGEVSLEPCLEPNTPIHSISYRPGQSVNS